MQTPAISCYSVATTAPPIIKVVFVGAAMIVFRKLATAVVVTKLTVVVLVEVVGEVKLLVVVLTETASSLAFAPSVISVGVSDIAGASEG